MELQWPIEEVLEMVEQMDFAKTWMSASEKQEMTVRDASHQNIWSIENRIRLTWPLSDRWNRIKLVGFPEFDEAGDILSFS